jgi:hypothetical protein
MSVPSYEEIQVKSIDYQIPEKQGHVYYAPISYKGGPLMVMSPRLSSACVGTECLHMKTPLLHASVVGQDFSFYDFMLKMDDRNVKETCQRSQAWFQKAIPMDLIDDMYKRTNKPLKTNEKPSFHLRIPILKGEAQCKVFDQHKVCHGMEAIQPGMEFSCVIHFKGLKFLKHHYYCDCYLSQIKVHIPDAQPYHILDTCVFSDDSDLDDMDDIEGEDEERMAQEAQAQKDLEAQKEAKAKEILEQRNTLEQQLADKEGTQAQLVQEVEDIRSQLASLND